MNDRPCDESGCGEPAAGGIEWDNWRETGYYCPTHIEGAALRAFYEDHPDFDPHEEFTPRPGFLSVSITAVRPRCEL